MFVSNTFIQTLCFIIFVTKVLGSRKYDIEAESMKLYKEDVKTALQHFRRSPDYLKILEDKNTEFVTSANEIQKLILFYNMDQLKEKVRDFIGTNPTPKLEETTTAIAPSALIFRYGHIKRRDDAAAKKKNKSGVEILDAYPKFSSLLTLAQRNKLKEMGFTQAGEIIHALIKNLGADLDSGSTVQPNGGNQEPSTTTTTTTEHVSVHVVTSEPSEEEATTEAVTTSATTAASAAEVTTTHAETESATPGSVRFRRRK